MEIWGATDRGMVRKQNQDTFRWTKLNDSQFLAVVCDGMGGAKSGDVASKLASEVFEADISQSVEPDMDQQSIVKMLVDGVKSANRAVYEQSLVSPDFKGMGTTLVAVFLQGQVFGLCRCFDGLPDLLNQCMRLPVLLVDHLQSARQLCQQSVVFVGKFPHLLGFYSGQGRMPLQMFEQLCNLPLRELRGLYQPLDPFQLDIIQTCVSCAACLGVFDGFDKRFLEVFIHFDREVDLIFVVHGFPVLRLYFHFGSSFLFFESASVFHRSYCHRLGRGVEQRRDSCYMLFGTFSRLAL